MYCFLVIIEKGSKGYGTYSPDLPVCVAVGDTLEEVEKNMREAPDSVNGCSNPPPQRLHVNGIPSGFSETQPLVVIV